jgi:hypothetical protein
MTEHDDSRKSMIGPEDFPANMRGKVRFDADYDATITRVEEAGMENLQHIPIRQFAGRVATMQVADKIAGIKELEWLTIADENTLWPE